MTQFKNEILKKIKNKKKKKMDNYENILNNLAQKKIWKN